jgi:DNA-binding transcriptional ArsR family regulator
VPFVGAPPAPAERVETLVEGVALGHQDALRFPCVRDGRTLTELGSEVEMTRFGVMKHLRVLEDAGLVVVRRSGREKLHFLNPVPIRLIHDRWIDKYTERQVSALADLKTTLEEEK